MLIKQHVSSLKSNYQSLVNLMVECRFYTANTAVRFCHEVPNNFRYGYIVSQVDGLPWKQEDAGAEPATQTTE